MGYMYIERKEEIYREGERQRQRENMIYRERRNKQTRQQE